MALTNVCDVVLLLKKLPEGKFLDLSSVFWSDDIMQNLQEHFSPHNSFDLPKMVDLNLQTWGVNMRAGDIVSAALCYPHWQSFQNARVIQQCY